MYEHNTIPLGSGEGEQAANGLPAAASPSPSGVYRVADAVRIPPSGNTGVSNTTCCFDWLAFTVQINLQTVLEWLTPVGHSGADWVVLAHGGLGYRSAVQRGHVKVFYDGQPGMGVHVVMSGQALRQWEVESGLRSEGDWQAFLRTLVKERECRLTRLDAAMDDKGEEGVLSMAVMEQAARAGHLVSRFHHCQRIGSDKWSLSNPEDSRQGETLYFGSRSSLMFVRIYNKAAEMGESFHHVRVEMEAKKENAGQLAEKFLEGGWRAVVGVLRAYLDFKEPEDGDGNKSRWETAEWWDTFLDRCEKVSLCVARVVNRSLERVKAWLFRQAAPSLAVLVATIERECDVSGANARREAVKAFYGLVEYGRPRLKAKHKMMIEGYAPSLGFGCGI